MSAGRSRCWGGARVRSAFDNPDKRLIWGIPNVPEVVYSSDLVGKAKSGNISASDVESGNGFLNDLHNAASQGGAAFTDNTSVNP